MAMNGLLGHAKSYPLFIDTRADSSAQAMMDDLAQGDIDCGILWGPMAGYYARQANPPMIVVPLTKETTGPQMTYRIGMAVRAADQEWKRTLNRLIMENQAEINKLLISYNIPILDEGQHADHIRDAFQAAMIRTAAPLRVHRDHRCRRRGRSWPRCPSRMAIAWKIIARRRPLRCVASGSSGRTKRKRSGAAIRLPLSMCCREPPRPRNLPEGTLWHDKPRADIPGSIWLPDTGYGELAPSMAELFLQGPGEGDAWRSRQGSCSILSGELLDVVERSQARALARLFECRVVSRRNRWLARRRPSAGRCRRRSRVQTNEPVYSDKRLISSACRR